MADEERKPVNVKCTACGHVWVAAHVPMPLAAFAKALAAVECPSCKAGPKLIALASNCEPANG